jgi:hypothetical protein
MVVAAPAAPSSKPHPVDDVVTRRAFGQRALGSLLVVSLLGLLRGSELFASSAAPHWLAQLDALGRDVKRGALPQVAWQDRVEAIQAGVDVQELLAMIDVDAMTRTLAAFSDRGALSLGMEFPRMRGVPDTLVFGCQVFGMKRGRSIVPHGHDSMATAFLVLRGTCRARHYDRLADEGGFMIITPTIDREIGVGGTSSISDVKDNVHWLQARTDATFVFNIHVTGLASNPRRPQRVYVDPGGEKIAGGRIRARLLDHDTCTALYG